MIKLLILGSSGMLGTACLQYFSQEKDIEVFSASRTQDRFNPNRHFSNPDLITDIAAILKKNEFDYIINCIGDTTKNSVSEDLLSLFQVNSLFPKMLAGVAKRHQAKVLHISTDCVFSGITGNYSELSAPEPSDLYGISKLLGEEPSDHNKVIRTSIIGPEDPSKNRGLLNWFLSQKGVVYGYEHAYFTGLTTWELAAQLHTLIIKNWQYVPNLVHLPGPKISKLELLQKLARLYSTDSIIIPNTSVTIDRSLTTQYKLNQTVKSWDQMLMEQYKNVEIRK